ncbi:FGGY-family carbohydrate kinase [Rhizobium leguminosarum]|uniref:FGGY-family carbohydrate kinase n=1 Tax=Rhizobium leguminosarum TaxID=384 RepID=UPI001AE9E639|nr:FGGY-family carbohydrate kinase [Rhizobium leguminosarum]MBP2448447.1 xylulokinase [Rhizobium leguminosarum]
MRYLLGIDIGSYSSKGVLLDEKGGITAVAQRKHEMRVPGPGLAEHDAEQDWWAGFCDLSKQLIAQSGIDPVDICAVACSGIGPCMLPIGKENEPLRTAILYGIDTRAHQEIGELNGELGEERIFQQCGNALTTQSVGPKIRWLAKNEPEIYAKTHKIVGCSSYLVFKLTGRWVVDHYGASCYTPCYDLATHGWDAAMTSPICPVGWLPDILWTSEIAGTINDAAAAVTGLKAGTPVITGTIDSASEAVSVGVQSPGDLMIMYGTTAFFIQVNRELSIDNRCWAAPFLFPGTWSTMGGLATAGGLTHWFRDNIIQTPDDDAFFGNMAQEAMASPPGANGLLVLPYFSGERTPINDPLAKGVFFGLTLAHSRGDLYRSMIEGIGHAVRHNLDTFAEIEPRKFVYAVGGGVKNPLWTQSVSDIANVEQRVRRHTVGAALGSAFLAGLGAGIFERQDIEIINPVDAIIEADSRHSALYDDHHAVYRKLYENTKDLMRAL